MDSSDHRQTRRNYEINRHQSQRYRNLPDESRTPRNERKIFVANLGANITEDDLIDHFKRYGVIQKATVIRDDGRTRGFGYVLFTEKDRIAELLDPNYVHIVRGRVLDCQPVRPKAEKLHLMTRARPSRNEPPGYDDTAKDDLWRLTQLELGLIEPEPQKLVRNAEWKEEMDLIQL